MTDVFISYSRKDKAFVQTLHNAIVTDGRDTWVDWEGIPLTADWWLEIQEGIEGADTFVFIISPDSAASKVCKQELEHATELNKRIVPIVHRETEDVPEELRHLNWIFCRTTDNFDSAYQNLMQAMDTDLEWVKAHTRLTQRAAEWNKKNRNYSYLLTGDDLSEAEQHQTQKDKKPYLTELQAQYILASRQNATRRQRRLLTGVAAGLVIALILALSTFLQFLRAEREKNLATARELASHAQANLFTDPELSALLALQAVSTADAPQAWTALTQAVQSLDLQQTIPESISAVAFSPDGNKLAIFSPDEIIIRDMETDEDIQAFEYEAWVTDIEFSPDGQKIAVTSEDGVSVWNIDSEELLFFLTEQHINAVAFSPDGSRLASASGDGGSTKNSTPSTTPGTLDSNSGKLWPSADWIIPTAFRSWTSVTWTTAPVT